MILLVMCIGIINIIELVSQGYKKIIHKGFIDKRREKMHTEKKRAYCQLHTIQGSLLQLLECLFMYKLGVNTVSYINTNSWVL